MATLYSAGHGNRSREAFLDLLRSAGINRVVDVRAVPRSGRYPHFGYGPLGAALQTHAMAYEWRGKALGGLRRSAGGARHPGLQEPAFRAFAEHMESPLFRTAAAGLVASALHERVCLVCAERDPARCHRSLISDWLVVNGHEVQHLIEPGAVRAHALHPAARSMDGRIEYAGLDHQGSLF